MGYSQTELGRIGTSGGDILLLVDVSPDAATGDIIISDVDNVYVMGVVTLIEDGASNAQESVQAKEDSSTKNKVNIKLWKAPGSAASADYKDFRLALLLKDSVI